MSLAPGMKLGPYEIVAPIGAGGMGEVWKARDTRLDRIVAIKTSAAQFNERFEREARAVAALNHPHICTLHDVGPDYLVMEYVEGKPLAGPLPLAEGLQLAIQIAEALSAAHRKGITHRDLKPANILVTKSAGVKLLDFGLAKLSSEPRSVDVTLTKALTQENTILGTLQYMSPETLQGQQADARSDIFSFGCVLYEMFTGKRAFDGTSAATIIAAVMTTEPAPVAPPALNHLIRTCMAKDADERRQNIHDVLLELRWLASAPEVQQAPAPAPARKWGLALASGIAVLSTGLLGWRLLRETPAELPVLRYTIEAPPKVQFGTTRFGPARISPDGTMLLLRIGEGSESSIWIRKLSEVEARPLAGTEGATYPFWSDDSRHIGFFADTKLKRVAAEGGPVQTVCAAPSGRGGAWHGGGDGVIVFAADSTVPLSRVAASGGQPTIITALDPARKETSHRLPHFLPGGKRFLYFALSATADAAVNVEQSSVMVGELASGQPAKRLMAGETEAMWSPTGHLLFVRERNLMAQAFDLGRLALSGEPVPIAENVETGSNRNTGAFSISTGGILTFRASGSSDVKTRLVWIDRQSKEVETISVGENLLTPSLSPDGKTAAGTKSGANQAPDIWLVDLVRRASSRFTFDPGAENTPVWSPDGKQIAYIKTTNTEARIMVKSAAGVGEARELLNSKGIKRLGGWTRDGKWILYTEGEARAAIFALPVGGDGKPVELVPATHPVRTPVPSPDGKYFAYASSESSQSEIFVRTFSPGAREEGGKWQISTKGGFGVVGWRADGKELVFVSSTGLGIMSVPIQPGASFQAGTPAVIFQSSRPSGAMTADGQRFLIASAPESQTTARENIVINWPAALLRKK